MTETLIPEYDVSGGTCLGNKAYFQKLRATKTGQLTTIQVYSNSDGGNVKVAIYTDNGTTPGTRLGYKNTNSAIVTGTNDITLVSPVNITGGEFYWLAVAVDDNASIINSYIASGSRYIGIPYAAYTFPETADISGSGEYGTVKITGAGTEGSGYQLLLGNLYSTTSSITTDDYLHIGKYTALESGTLDSIDAYISKSCNIKVAIYSDNEGSPGTKLASSSSTAVSAPWASVEISPVPITEGTAYWLSIISDDANIYTGSGGESYRKAETYSSYSYPTTFDTTSYTQATSNLRLTGWGLSNSNKPAIMNLFRRRQ